MLTQLAPGARDRDLRHGVGCQLGPATDGATVERHILVKRARMSGFLVFDYAHRYEEAVARLADWVRAGTSCVIAKISPTASSIAPAPSPDYIAAKISASG